VWKLPPDFNESAYAQVRFVLTREGTVADSCISRSSDSRLAKSTLDALDAASPFPPIPDLARCIAGTEIVRHVHSAQH
jgi:TonB family protein